MRSASARPSASSSSRARAAHRCRCSPRHKLPARTAAFRSYRLEGMNMTGVYSQSTGELNHDGSRVGSGYSGHGEGLNNPAFQTAHDVGPLPQGMYSIGDPLDPPDHLGPLAMPLSSTSGDMFGRSAFFI